MEITAEKIKLVRKQLRAGVPEGEIKTELLAEGYSEEDLEKIFIPHRPDMQRWYLVFAILFFVVGFYNLVTGSSYLFLVFAAAMFAVYYAERHRIKNKKI